MFINQEKLYHILYEYLGLKPTINCSTSTGHADLLGLKVQDPVRMHVKMVKYAGKPTFWSPKPQSHNIQKTLTSRLRPYKVKSSPTLRQLTQFIKYLLLNRIRSSTIEQRRACDDGAGGSDGGEPPTTTIGASTTTTTTTTEGGNTADHIAPSIICAILLLFHLFWSEINLLTISIEFTHVHTSINTTTSLILKQFIESLTFDNCNEFKTIVSFEK